MQDLHQLKTEPGLPMSLVRVLRDGTAIASVNRAGSGSPDVEFEAY